MRWIADTDLARYADRVLPYLLHEPVRNNVACTLIQVRLDGLTPVEPGALWLAGYNETGELAGVALRTPPHPLLVTNMSDAAADALADHLARAEPRLSSAAGAVAPSRRFATRYADRLGYRTEQLTASRMFELTTVVPPSGVPGEFREATAADRDLLVAWSAAFEREAVPGATGLEDPAWPIDMRLGKGRLLWLWQVAGAPVSMAWLNLPASGVVRVSGVYTPQDQRGRGYASACVAAASQYALDTGAAACMLYTNLANPTSNKIYQALGYRPVTDAAEWTFSPSSPSSPSI